MNVHVGTRAFSIGVLCVGIVTSTAPTVLAGQQHARSRLCRYAGCTTVNAYKPDSGEAIAIVNGPLGSYMKADAKTNYYWGVGWWPGGKGFSGGWHAEHHSSGSRVTADSAEAVPTPKPGEPGHATIATLIGVPGASPNTVILSLHSSSFLQLDLSAPEAGNLPLTAKLTIIVAGEHSTVSLIATPRGERYLVEASVTGKFVGHELSVRPAGNQLHVLQFTSAPQWTVQGKPETLDIGVEGEFCIGPCKPAQSVISEWGLMGLIALVLLLVLAALWFVWKRRARPALF